MKTLIVSFIIWIFIVPCAVAIYLVFGFLTARAPNFYFVCTCLAITLAPLAIIWGSFWILNSSRESSAFSPVNHQRSTSFTEKNHEKYLDASRPS